MRGTHSLIVSFVLHMGVASAVLEGPTSPILDFNHTDAVVLGGGESSTLYLELEGVHAPHEGKAIADSSLYDSLLICLLVGMQGGGDCGFIEGGGRRLGDDPNFAGLNAILKNMVITIPGPYESGSDNAKGGIKDISVLDGHFGSIKLSSALNPAQTQVDITLVMTGFQVTIKGSWYYHILIWGDDSGTLSASCTNGDVTLTVSVLSPAIETTPLNSMKIAACNANLALGNIQTTASAFSGKYIAPLIIPLVTGKLTSTLNSQVCQILQGTVTDSVNKLLVSYDGWAAPLLKPLPPPPPVADVEKQIQASLKKDERLVSWRDFKLLKQARAGILGDLDKSDPNDPNSALSKINSALVGALGAAGVNIAVNSMLYSGESSIIDAAITLKSVTPKGLDTLKQVSLLKMVPDSNYTMESTLKWDRFDVDVVFDITLSTKKDGQETKSVSTVTVSVGVRNITVGVMALFVVDQNAVLKTHVGSLIDNAIGCALSAVPAIKVVRLNLQVGNVIGPTISGMVDTGLNQLLNDAITAFRSAQLNVLLQMVPQLVDKYATTALNDAIMQQVQKPEYSSCPKYIPPKIRQSLPLKTSALWKTARNYAEDYIHKSGFDVAKLMQLILPSVLPFSGPGIWGYGTDAAPLGAYPIPLGSAGTLQIVFTTLEMHGIDQIFNMTVLEPLTDAKLHNEIFLGYKPTSNVNFTLGINIHIDSPPGAVVSKKPLYDYLLFTAGMGEMHIQLNLNMDLNLGSLYNLTVGTLINSPVCAMKAMEHWGFGEFPATVNKAWMVLNCKSCTSPAFYEINKKLKKIKNLQGLIDTLNNGFANAGSGGQGILRNLPVWLDNVVYGNVDPLVRSMCPATFDEMGRNQPPGMWRPLRQEIPGEYDHPDGPDQQQGGGAAATPAPESHGTSGTAAPFEWPSGLAMIGYGVIGGQVVIAILWGVYRYTKFSKHSKEGKAAIITDQDVVGLPLFLHPSIPLWVKIYVPLSCVAMIALFYSAHTMTGGSFDVVLTLAGEEVKIEQFYEFTLSMSIRQALQAHSYSLAFLLGVLSGIWPYLKVELMLFAWFLPPRFLGKVGRAKLLNYLDRLGKWSQVDLYVLVLLMVCFNIKIDSPAGFQGVFDAGFLTAHVQLNPKWGIYGFVLAVMLAISTNQLIVWYNRKTNRDVLEAQIQRRQSSVEPSTSTKTLEDGPSNRKAPLFSHKWEASDGQHYIAYGTCGILFVTLLILSTFCFILLGALTPSLGLVYHGLGASGIEWNHKNGSAPIHNIVTMTAIISNQASSNPAGILFLQGSIYLFTLIAPLIYILVLARMWLARLTVTQQEKLLYAAEILKDWTCLDVFVVAYVVTLLEVGHLADFVGGQAGAICNFVGQIAVGGDAAVNNGDLCFGLKAQPLSPGIPFICISVIMLIVVQLIVGNATEEAVHDREPHELFQPGHRPSSSYMDLVLEREKPSIGFVIGKLLPKWIVTVGSIEMDSQGKKRYMSTISSEENFVPFIARKLSKKGSGLLKYGEMHEDEDLPPTKKKFNKPNMTFKRPEDGKVSKSTISNPLAEDFEGEMEAARDKEGGRDGTVSDLSSSSKMGKKSSSAENLAGSTSPGREESGGLMGFVNSIRKSFSGGDVRSHSNSADSTPHAKFAMASGAPGNKRKTLVKTKSASGHVRPMTLLKEADEEREEGEE